MTITRRDMTRGLLGCAIAGVGAVAFGADYDRARDLVAKVQNDLQRAADFTRTNEKERDRYHNVQKKLSEFDADLRRGKFEKGKLDDAIEDLKNVVKENTLESHDRDELARDLSDLRTLRDVR
jgi:acyl-CoA synthetase (AMP-forming)/AMP-acid ligase II